MLFLEEDGGASVRSLEAEEAGRKKRGMEKKKQRSRKEKNSSKKKGSHEKDPRNREEKKAAWRLRKKTPKAQATVVS